MLTKITLIVQWYSLIFTDIGYHQENKQTTTTYAVEDEGGEEPSYTIGGHVH
jgi:hypothetical protein